MISMITLLKIKVKFKMNPAPSEPTLLKIHLRYNPPGIILEYLDAYGTLKEKSIDLLELNGGSDEPRIATELLNSEPLFTSHNHRMKVFLAVEKLKKHQLHDYSQRYIQLQCFKPHALPITDVALTKEGMKCATSCLGNACKIWCTQTGKEIGTLVGHQDSVTSINFNFSGDQILTSSEDGSIRHWFLNNDKVLTCHNVLNCTTNYDPCPSLKILFSKFSPDYSLALSACNDKSATVHDLSKGQMLHKFIPDVPDPQDLSSLNLDRSGRLLLASPYDDSEAALFDLRSGQVSMDDHQATVTKSLFDFGGGMIATSSMDCSIKLWDIRNLDNPFYTHSEFGSPVLDMEFDSKGKSLVFGTQGGKLTVLDIEQGKQLFETKLENSKISKVLWSHNGSLVLGCSDSGVVAVYHSDLGTNLQLFQEHTSRIVGAEFSYDSQHLLTASKDKTVRIYKLTEIV